MISTIYMPWKPRNRPNGLKVTKQTKIQTLKYSLSPPKVAQAAMQQKSIIHEDERTTAGDNLQFEANS